MVQFCYLRLYFGIVSCRLQDIQQPDKYDTDSDKENDEEGDFEVVYGRTCVTRSGRSVRLVDHHWCVWIYEAGVILMVIRLNLISTYSNDQLIGVSIATLIQFYFFG